MKPSASLRTSCLPSILFVRLSPGCPARDNCVQGARSRRGVGTPEDLLGSLGSGGDLFVHLCHPACQLLDIALHACAVLLGLELRFLRGRLGKGTRSTGQVVFAVLPIVIPARWSLRGPLSLRHADHKYSAEERAIALFALCRTRNGPKGSGRGREDSQGTENVGLREKHAFFRWNGSVSSYPFRLPNTLPPSSNAASKLVHHNPNARPSLLSSPSLLLLLVSSVLLRFLLSPPQGGDLRRGLGLALLDLILAVPCLLERVHGGDLTVPLLMQ